MKGAKKIAKAKLATVEEFTHAIQEYPIVGIVNMENLPAKQLQNMRHQLRGTVRILMTKKRLIKIVLENCKDERPHIQELGPHIVGMPAMIFTHDNPFKLYKRLQENKSTAPAKAGQVATKDIVIPAGPTPFAPGPIIGELGSLRIKTGIEDGKVAIKETVTIVKAGEGISAKIASILGRLSIEPMEIGLDLVAVYENGSLYTGDILRVDEEVYRTRIACAAQESLRLAIGIVHTTKDTITLLLQRAHTEARQLGIGRNIPADEVVAELLARAERQVLGLKSHIEGR